MSIGVADVVWSWTSKDVKIRQAKEEDVVKGWDATEQDEACDPIFILGSFGGVQIRQGISGTKGKRPRNSTHFGKFCQVQNDGRKSLSVQIVMGHGKCVGERKLTSMQLKISFLVRVKMESFRWLAARVKSPRVRPGAEEKASGARAGCLTQVAEGTRSSKAVGRCRSG